MVQHAHLTKSLHIPNLVRNTIGRRKSLLVTQVTPCGCSTKQCLAVWYHTQAVCCPWQPAQLCRPHHSIPSPCNSLSGATCHKHCEVAEEPQDAATCNGILHNLKLSPKQLCRLNRIESIQSPTAEPGLAYSVAVVSQHLAKASRAFLLVPPHTITVSWSLVCRQGLFRRFEFKKT